MYTLEYLLSQPAAAKSNPPLDNNNNAKPPLRIIGAGANGDTDVDMGDGFISLDADAASGESDEEWHGLGDDD